MTERVHLVNNHTTCEAEGEKDGESNGSPNGSPIDSHSPTNRPSRYPAITIIFVLFWIIGIISFDEYLFVNKINNEILNENPNVNCNSFCNELVCWVPNRICQKIIFWKNIWY